MIKAWITDKLDSWNSIKDTAKMFNKSTVMQDDSMRLSFSNGDELYRIRPTCVESDALGMSFDSIHFLKNVATYKDIKIGMLLVRDLDGFMLGTRWLVEEKKEDGSFYAHAYYCGESSEYNMCDWIIKDDGAEYLYQENETLKLWQCKFKRGNDKKIILVW